MAIFKDRREAGKKLAEELTKYKNQQGVIVLGLPRGGAPVAYEIAEALNAPLDVFIVRKLGLPGQPVQAFGLQRSTRRLHLCLNRTRQF